MNDQRSCVYNQYKEIIHQTVSNDRINVQSEGSNIDILSIKPITNTWNCPICTYSHSEIVDDVPNHCVMCGYCVNLMKSSSIVAHHLEK